ncbi:ketoglutarate semialdehyde dehydrogenase [Candidatus Peribacteria bacterium RIFCSPHIGHO2_02_FULL_53_20]|nr:MAG: ketoglutarate semialdehyde dehydrogenase [Candidatus Peribacteria bacterium RIFCSPHIGHO2_02_FULL_53_20]OGJ68243.1 MAG: ketoglutarate semialdehyde dehydrogenase [Candidatus Peribacteria bacterium RIFCSPLOWO2_01_FULL_53_10]
MSSPFRPVLIGGAWKESLGTETFQATNPATEEKFGDLFPISPCEEVEDAVIAAAQAAKETRGWPGVRFASFLQCLARKLGETERANALVEMANAETALPRAPRLLEVELPRTINQLLQAAAAAIDGSWARPTIDREKNIRSILAPIGPVVVFGPNNFPFAFNGVSGGDFAAAIAAGNPVIAKGNPSHPGTTRLLAEAAFEAAKECGMPHNFIQLIYHMSEDDGLSLVSHDCIGATAFTGSRTAGQKLKAAADDAGKPFYMETGSINPVVILPGALKEHFDKVLTDYVGSCLMGTGQFCTSPKVVVMLAGSETERWIGEAAEHFGKATVGTLLSESVLKNLQSGVGSLKLLGATTVTGGDRADGQGFRFQNTLLRVDGETFSGDYDLQCECFGNAALIVVAIDADELLECLEALEGNLTGTIYSATNGGDDALYNRIEPGLRRRVGRLLNDKMPTGVAVSPAMNHGGPYPATGHPGFTAVGIPRSLERFAALQCYDNVRQDRLPPTLRDK